MQCSFYHEEMHSSMKYETLLGDTTVPLSETERELGEALDHECHDIILCCLFVMMHSLLYWLEHTRDYIRRDVQGVPK